MDSLLRARRDEPSGSPFAVRVAAYQAPLLPCGSMESLGRIRRQVARCEAEGVEILCCPEAILGSLADYAPCPADVAFDVEAGQFDDVLMPLASDTVTTIRGSLNGPVPIRCSTPQRLSQRRRRRRVSEAAPGHQAADLSRRRPHARLPDRRSDLRDRDLQRLQLPRAREDHGAAGSDGSNAEAAAAVCPSAGKHLRGERRSPSRGPHTARPKGLPSFCIQTS